MPHAGDRQGCRHRDGEEIGSRHAHEAVLRHAGLRWPLVDARWQHPCETRAFHRGRRGYSEHYSRLGFVLTVQAQALPSSATSFVFNLCRLRRHKLKEKGLCEDTSRSGRDSAPAPREILTRRHKLKEKGWCEDTSRSSRGSAPAPREILTIYE